MNLDPSDIKKNSLYPNLDLEDEDDDSWQVSYLDIITIILGFLIILLSVSQITKSEFSSLSELFGKLSDQTEYITTPIEDIQEELETLLADQIALDQLEIVRDLNDLKIRFSSDDFYSSGSSDLQPGAMVLLNHVLRAFQQTSYSDFEIDVEGHTDNVPISSVSFPSNWELSTARASNIVRYFDDMGLEVERLKASGYADSRPRIQYDSEGLPFAASKELNRRVVLRLYYTAKALQDRASQEALAEDNTVIQEKSSSPDDKVTDSNTEELVEKNNEPTLSEQLATQITEVSKSNKKPEQSPESVVKKEVPKPSVPKTPVSSSNALPIIPSFLDATSSCKFSVQIGGFQPLPNSFRVANNAEDKTGLDFEVSYNNDVYSVRSKSTTSLQEVLSTYRTVTSSLGGETVGLIHQCYASAQKIPSSIQYQVQFGAFQSSDNALNYTVKLYDDYQIQTYMNRMASTYNVVARPFSDRETVLTQMNEFRGKGIQDGIFIKPVPESISDYKFQYQLQLASFSSEEEAKKLSKQILDQTEVKTSIANIGGSTFFVFTERSGNWEETLSLLDDFKTGNIRLSPILYLLEYL